MGCKDESHCHAGNCIATFALLFSKIDLKYLLAPVYLLYKLWIGLVFWLTLVFLFPLFWILLRRKKWFPKAFSLKRFWAKLFEVLLFCPVRVHYKGQLPKTPYIIVSNHSSYLDTVFMYRAFSDYFLFIGKGELLHWPLFRLFFKKMDIPVERSSSVKAYNALQKAYEAIDRGECIALYPEGTIPHSAPRMKSFKNGAFKMAIDKQVPIVPVTWQTCYKIMKDPGEIWSPSLPQKVRVVIHKPVEVSGYSVMDVIDLRSHVFEIIDSELPAEFRKQHES